MIQVESSALMIEARPFYADPLAAAWMAKHFGMRFDGRDYEDSPPPFTFSFMHNDVASEIVQGVYKYYIHPDSVKLLEPQEGDITQDPISNNCYALGSVPDTNWFHKNKMRIIQRQGKAFIWPDADKLGGLPDIIDDNDEYIG